MINNIRERAREHMHVCTYLHARALVLAAVCTFTCDCTVAIDAVTHKHTHIEFYKIDAGVTERKRVRGREKRGTDALIPSFNIQRAHARTHTCTKAHTHMCTHTGARIHTHTHTHTQTSYRPSSCAFRCRNRATSSSAAFSASTTFTWWWRRWWR